ncbi:MAG: SRPBCC family protein [Actinobacteria bacterium]|nr:SRPBCC family protein [Actinomycetota bacterium]
MQLEHSFTVPVGIDEAWKVLLDIERVAPCMPGAAIETIDGDAFTGSVKVKLGAISLTYKGQAKFIEKDEAAHRATIEAQGKDSRGGGTAGANVTATLVAENDSSTRVDVLTDLNITGKPAQFGRGVMVDVGNKLIGQFAKNLADQISASPSTNGAAEQATSAGGATPPAAAPTASTASGSSTGSATPSTATVAGAPTASGTSTASTAPRAAAEVEPIDLLASAGPAVAKRLAPVVGGLLFVVALLVLRRRKR